MLTVPATIGNQVNRDDTPALQAILDAAYQVELRPSFNYFLRNLSVSSFQLLDGSGATIKPAAANTQAQSEPLIRVDGGSDLNLRATIRNLYFTDAENRLRHDDACILVRRAENFLLDRLTFESTNTCIELDSGGQPGSTGKGTIRNIFGKWLYRRGIHLGRNVHDVLFDDIQLWAGQPHSNHHDPDIGVLIDARGSTIGHAVGGNRFQNVSLLDFNHGFVSYQSQMLFFNNCIADTLNSEWGASFYFREGTDKAMLTNCFAGTTAYGVMADGGSINISLNSLSTWHLTKYAIWVEAGSSVTIDKCNWSGNNKSTGGDGQIVTCGGSRWWPW